MKHLDDVSEEKATEQNVNIGRREALAKLGLMAVVTYAAPLILKISDAHAKGGSGGSGGSGGGSGPNPRRARVRRKQPKSRPSRPRRHRRRSSSRPTCRNR